MAAKKQCQGKLKSVGVLLCVLTAAPAIAGEAPDTAPAAPVDEAPGVFPAAPPMGVPSLQMSTDYASPALAIGSYRPSGELMSGGVRVAPFTVRAGVHTGLGYDDNVTLSSVNKTSSMFLTVSPSVAVGLDGATQRYYVVYRGNYGRYFSSGADDYADHNVALSAAHEWSARLRSLVMYEHVRGHDQRGATIANLTEPERWRVNAIRGSGSYGAEGAQGRVEGSVAYFTKKYDSSRPAGVARDYDQFEVGGAFFYRLAPKTRALVEVRHAEISHAQDPQLDSSEMRYLVGATWDATANTSGTFRAGYMVKDVDNPAASDFSGPTYEASVTWMPLVHSRVELNARRTFNEPVDVGSSFVVDNFLSGAWIYLWPDGIQSTFGYTYGEQRHEGLGRTDTYHSVGLKATYPLRRNVRIGAELRRDVRSSPLPGLDFERNLTLVTVEAAL